MGATFRKAALSCALVLMATGAAWPATSVAAPPPPTGPTPTSPAPPNATASVPAGPHGYQGLTPARILDTRAGASTVDGQQAGGGAVAAGLARSLPVLGRGGAPAGGVAAVVLNVTVTAGTANSFLTVFPAGAAVPNTSNLNFAAGQTVPNMVMVKVGTGGAVGLVNKLGSVDVVADVMGWFPDDPTFTGVSPARLADTRAGAATVDGLETGTGAIAANGPRDVTVLGRGGVPATGVGSVVVNLTVTGGSANSFLTGYPAGAARPNTSNVNFAAGQTVPNLAVLKVGVGGKISLANAAGSVHAIVDVMGWFPPGATFTGLAPARLMDTRPGAVTVDGSASGGGAVTAASPRSLDVLGRGGVPTSGVGAVVVNVTVTGGSANSFLTAFPTGESVPNASTVNFAKGETVPNLVVVKLGAGGKVSFANALGATHVIVDVLGWFSSATNQLDAAAIIAGPGEVQFTSFDRAGPSSFVYVGASDLRTDSVISFVAADGPWYGRVTGATPHAGGGVDAQATPATLMDLYPNLDLSLMADTTTGAPTVLEATSGALPVSLDTPTGSFPSATTSTTATCTGSVTTTANVNVTADAGTFVLDVHWTPWDGPTDLKLSYAPSFKATAHAGIAGTGSCDLAVHLFTVNLPTIKFLIGPVPVWITHSLAADLKGTLTASASASIDLGVTASAELGVAWNEATGFAPVQTTSITKSIDPKVAIEAAATLEVPATYSARAYGILGFDAVAGPKLDLKVKPLEHPWLTLDGSIEASLTAKFELALGAKDWKKEHSLAKGTLVTKRLLTLPDGPLTGVRIAAGFDHACAIVDTDKVKCWGTNNLAQIGDGTMIDRLFPVDVPGLSGVTDLSATSFDTCAVVTAGNVKCWGMAFNAPPSAPRWTSPTPIAGITGATQLSLGLGSAGPVACALVGPAPAPVKCWGDNSYGSLGDGSTSDSAAPVNVVGIADASQISVGTGATCALVTGGHVRCWGAWSVAGVGSNSATPVASSVPIEIAGIAGAVQVSAGGFGGCAVLADGHIMCWGFNDDGQLGNGTTNPALTPTAVTGISNAVEVQLYGSHCARLVDGQVTCWGSNNWGELLDGTHNPSYVPVPVPGITTATQLSTGGYFFACAKVTTQAFTCWGDNYWGQLGRGFKSPHPSGFQNPLPPGDVSQ